MTPQDHGFSSLYPTVVKTREEERIEQLEMELDACRLALKGIAIGIRSPTGGELRLCVPRIMLQLADKWKLTTENLGEDLIIVLRKKSSGANIPSDAVPTDSTKEENTR